MIMQPITIDLPQSLLDLVKQRAESSQRTVQQEIVDLVAEKLTEEGHTEESITEALQSLELLNDDQLWQTASMTMSQEISDRSADLNDKDRNEGLTAAEREERRRLVEQYERHILIRGKAMALLKERGHDITPLLVPPPGT